MWVFFMFIKKQQKHQIKCVDTNAPYDNRTSSCPFCSVCITLVVHFSTWRCYMQKMLFAVTRSACSRGLMHACLTISSINEVVLALCISMLSASQGMTAHERCSNPFLTDKARRILLNLVKSGNVHTETAVTILLLEKCDRINAISM